MAIPAALDAGTTKKEMETKFQEFKTKFIAWCKANGACEDEFRKVLASGDFSALLALIHANFNWCMEKKLDIATLKELGDDVLWEARIVVNDNSGKSLTDGVWCIAESTVKAYDSSTVEAYNSSTVEAYDSSTVEAWVSSTVEAYGSSTVEAYGSSTVKACDSSTVKAYDSSTVKAYGSSTVKAWDWAIIHVKKDAHKLELGSSWKMEDVQILASGNNETGA